MRSLALLVGVVLLAAAVIGTAYFLRKDEDENILRLSSTIEATDVDVAFQIPGRVSEVTVSEGDAVKAGAVVARLSPDELMERVRQLEASIDVVKSEAQQQQSTIELRRSVIESQITQAKSQAEAAKAAAVRVSQGLRPEEIRIAEADVAEAEATLAQRRADFERAEKLLKEGIISKQQFDVTQTAVRTAEATRDGAVQRLALAREGARREDVAEAEARWKAAQAAVTIAEAGRKELEVQQNALIAIRARERELNAQLDTARTQLGHTEIQSPLNGVVLTKNIESGEVVSAGTPVVTIANTNELWMNVYVPESQTGLVKLGQVVHIRVDSFPTETFSGMVSFVSSESEFTPKTILTQEERIKLVYRVKVSIDNSDQRLKPGMPADAEILLK